MATRFFIATAAIFSAPLGFTREPTVSAPEPPVDALIPWLLNEDRELRGIPFSEIIFDTTGKKVLPADPRNETDQRVIKQISGVLDEVVRRMNAPNSVIQGIARIISALSLHHRRNR